MAARARLGTDAAGPVRDNARTQVAKPYIGPMPDQPIPAATLVIFREAASGAPDLLMVERAKTMAFAGGAWVFPGGRIDPADYGACRGRCARPERRRRTRRCHPRNGRGNRRRDRLPGRRPRRLPPSAPHLHAGGPFGEALADAGATLDLAALIPFARWRPAHRHARIFDTHFYIAQAPADATATVDATENVRLAWKTAAQVLAESDAGAATIIYPTRRNLERLARFGDFAAARADAATHPIRTITPFLETRDGVEHLCIPGDCGYPITSEPLTAAVRG